MGTNISINDLYLKYAQVQDKYSNVNAHITNDNADYNDDNLFNSSATTQSYLPETSFAIEGLSALSFEELQSQLISITKDEELKEQLDISNGDLVAAYSQFSEIQQEIEGQGNTPGLNEKLKNAEAEKKNALSALNEAIEIQQQAEDALKRAKNEEEAAKNKYEEAKQEYDRIINQVSIEKQKAEADAYEEALSQYLLQDENDDTEEGESADKQSFSEILNAIRTSRGLNTGVQDSRISSAQTAMGNAEAKYKKAINTRNAAQDRLDNAKTSRTKAQINYDTKLNNYNNICARINQRYKDLEEISNTIDTIQAKVNELEEKISQCNFYNQNQEAIQALLDEKDPEKVAAREAAANKENVNNEKSPQAEKGLEDCNDVDDGQKTSGANTTNNTNATSNTTNTNEPQTTDSSEYKTMNLTTYISDAELALVKDNKIDLTEVIKVGSEYYPKYLISKAKDGKYHIYEHQLTQDGKISTELISLARKYGEKQNGKKKLGLDTISDGSGYMRDTKDTTSDNKKSKECLYLVDVNEDFSSCKFGSTYKKYKTESPLSFDLNGDGIKTSDNIVKFDINGDGKLDTIYDSADAILVFDKDGDGISGKDGSECFGNNTDLDGDGISDGYKNGFEALKALALKENLINNSDDMILDEKDLNFLKETYGLKMKANGYNSEAKSLSELGVTQINLAQTDTVEEINNFDNKGNNVMFQAGTSAIVNGKEVEAGDIWHKLLEEKNQFLKLTA